MQYVLNYKDLILIQGVLKKDQQLKTIRITCFSKSVL